MNININKKGRTNLSFPLIDLMFLIFKVTLTCLISLSVLINSILRLPWSLTNSSLVFITSLSWVFSLIYTRLLDCDLFPLLDNVFKKIDEGNYEEAETEIDNLEHQFGELPGTIQAKTHLNFLKD